MSKHERKYSKDDDDEDNINNVTFIFITKKRLGKHASTVERPCFLWGPHHNHCYTMVQ
jgi:hypothetical protein